VQDITIPMEGFDFQRTDNNEMINGSQTKNIKQLQQSIDSLDIVVTESMDRSYGPLLRDHLFVKDIQVTHVPDSLYKDKTGFRDAEILDSIARLPLREQRDIWNSAHSKALESRNAFSFDETLTKDSLTQLYKSKNDWHRKLSLPISVIIFFLIGAPLGAIIRKGGLGTPIVISVFFFVVYYIITLMGEKASTEGVWSAVMGMWLSSIVLTPVAIYLMIKATNDSSLLDTDWYYGKYMALRDRLAPYLNPIISRITGSAVWRACAKALGSLKRIRKPKQA
jgi:lipopolysaccharide export system permease protein